MTPPFPTSVRPIFRAVATTVVPEAAQLAPAEWEEVEDIVAAALAERPAAMRRQLGAFLRILQLAPLVRHGRPLTRLEPAARAAFLSALEHAPVLLLRRGLWGIRTLVFMGYYARPAAADAIGYRAHPDGWAACGGTIASVPFPPVDVTVEPL